MKKISELKRGACFTYGGVEWVKLWTEAEDGGTLALAADVLFNRAFDVDNSNDWRKSSLRRELNGPFLDALVQEGADRAAFLDLDSDLTADDGMTDYGTATDKITLRSDDLCRKFRDIAPCVDEWCWNLTPWTCHAEYSCFVRSAYPSGVLNYNNACDGHWGVRPICKLKSKIFVSVTDEAARAAAVRDARDNLLNALNDYHTEVWGEAMGAAVASLFSSKQDADEIAAENETAAEG